MAKNLSGDLRSPPPTVSPTAWWSSSTTPASGPSGSTAPPRPRQARGRDPAGARQGRGLHAWSIPILVAVTEDDDGTLEPLSLREKIRVSGLTFDAIAADAVRYA